MKSIELGMSGFDLSMVPKNWRPYESYQASAWDKARPVDVLVAKYPAVSDDVRRIAQRSGQPPSALRFMPLVSRQASWAGILAAPDAPLVGYVPVDGFF